jgi:hypothetical protein
LREAIFLPQSRSARSSFCTVIWAQRCGTPAKRSSFRIAGKAALISA